MGIATLDHSVHGDSSGACPEDDIVLMTKLLAYDSKAVVICKIQFLT